MNLRRRILSAQKFNGWTQPSRRKSTRQARKEEGRIVAAELDRGLDDQMDERFDWMNDVPPDAEDRVVWSDVVPGFTTAGDHAFFAEQRGRDPVYGDVE